MWKKLGLRFALALLVLSPLLMQSGSAFMGNSAYAIAQPYVFSIAGWESRNLFHSLGPRLESLLTGDDTASENDTGLVKAYFRLSDDISRFRSEINRTGAAPGAEARTEVDTLKARLAAAVQDRDRLTGAVEAILEKQIRTVLQQESVAAFPPVDFRFDRLPMILVTSPRAKIELKDSILLEPVLSLETATGLESKVETLGVSALVEGVGGLATYPSLVPPGLSLELTLTDVAHEWLHQYLFFHPLGRRYAASYEMRTINETVADMAGKEIGQQVYRLYDSNESGDSKKATPSLFDREMRRIRLKVDDLLAAGQVDGAERFMEDSRQALLRQGYYIRKLNQAYFAFHGSYADTPASTSPAGELLQTVRQSSTSLGQFLKTVAGITSYADLEKLASEKTH